MIRALCLAASLSWATNVASAQALPDEDRAAIGVAVDTFGAAMEALDHTAIADAIPPRVLAHIAEGAGVEVDAVRAALVAEMEKLADQAEIAEYRIDDDGMSVAWLDEDTPYALLPTQTIVRVDDRQVRVSSQTLALQDDDEWYLVRVSDPQQVAILREVYPGFANVEFEPSITEVID